MYSADRIAAIDDWNCEPKETAARSGYIAHRKA
jgi:hypothetical protein